MNRHNHIWDPQSYDSRNTNTIPYLVERKYIHTSWLILVADIFNNLFIRGNGWELNLQSVAF